MVLYTVKLRKYSMYDMIDKNQGSILHDMLGNNQTSIKSSV